MNSGQRRWTVFFGSGLIMNKIMLYADDRESAISLAKERARMCGWTDKAGRLKPVYDVYENPEGGAT